MPPLSHSKNKEKLDASISEEDYSLIATSFDKNYYLEQYIDIALSDVEPIIHYHTHGWREGRNPSADFETRYYLDVNPDVADSGQNPFLHYLQIGRAQGRLPKPPILHENILAIVSEHFDPQHYLDSNLDVQDAGVDPLTHYISYGWLEGRNPTRYFDTKYYLENQPDVARAGINPFIHYLTEGVKEGRKPSAFYIPPQDLEILKKHFDPVFYQDSYHITMISEVELISHYHFSGWREGYNPSPLFDVKYYLKSNPDVAHAEIDPFLHYLKTGQHEGRAHLPKLHVERNMLSKATSARIRSESWTHNSADIKKFSAQHLVEHIIKYSVGTSCVISISHDDYKVNFGGVQNVIGDECDRANKNDVNYLHLSPASPKPMLVAASGNDFSFLVNYNNVRFGVISANELATCIRNVSIDFSIVIHHLMGHSVYCIVSLIDAARAKTIRFWAHDFFATCTNYLLLRNDHTFCGAPSVSSGACLICCYGSDRPAHLDQIRYLFRFCDVEVVAPSRSALNNWLSYNKSLPVASQKVSPLASIIENGEQPNKISADSGKKLKIAHLGARDYHKGWPAFQTIALALKGDSRYKFVQLGASGKFPRLQAIDLIEVKVVPDNRTAMIDAIKENEIDIVIIWSPWPETFNYIVHEAITAGSYIITNKSLGNVIPAIYSCSDYPHYVVENVEEIVHLFRSGEIHDRLNILSARERHLSLNDTL